MDHSKGLGQNLDEFKRMTIELTNAGEKEKLSNENETIILLNSLPNSFKDVKATIKYGRFSLSLEECISALKSKDLELKIEKKDHGENLFARGKSSIKNSNPNNKYKSRSKTPNNRSQSRAALVASKVSDKGSLLYKRLGHMSEKGLGDLSKHNLLDRDQVIKLEFCENCVLGGKELESARDHAVGLVMYSMISTRPYLAQAINVLSSELELIGYVDSDYAGDRDKRRSTSSYFFTIVVCCLS
ncbi:hypothetical protein EZV62_007653 [Acer yangbiense]|uniref:GAG-pre-integrase domain-containing protein n=1 Tax=Acer yangbiense TaxID=1000413 RepID=A0A5C7IB57_9ROSI|nr:hypothetical protein EZV62_007653 [Acer yangbiense]